MPYDPIDLSEEIEEKVIRGEERKYYRFRDTKFYGGIATADCVGCNLMCRFCWSEKPRMDPEDVGSFYSPSEIAGKFGRHRPGKRLRQGQDFGK